MNASERALQGKDTATAKALYMAFELSDTKWILCLSDGVRKASQYTVGAGDQAAVLSCIAKARARCALGQEAVVHSCYEAGRDGFWLHRWLVEQGIDNMVVDSSSIEVNRRARRAKSDRLDAGKLLTMLMRYHAGERRLWSVARVPTAQEEDARRVHRELARLEHERTAHGNRIGSLLVLHNLRVKGIGGRNWRVWWQSHRRELPPCHSNAGRQFTGIASTARLTTTLLRRTATTNGFLIRRSLAWVSRSGHVFPAQMLESSGFASGTTIGCHKNQ
jgi:transposase